VIMIQGMTTEEGDRDPASPGAAHRHTFIAELRISSINSVNGNISGSIQGRTNQVISTGPDEEERHVHLIAHPSIVITPTGLMVATAIEDFHQHFLNVD
jgi:hypothetical protein